MPCRRVVLGRTEAAKHESVRIAGNLDTRRKTVGLARARELEAKERARKARAKARTKAMRAKELEVSRVYVGLRTLPTAGNAENLVTARETAEASQFWVKTRTLKTTGRLGTRSIGMSSSPNLKFGSTIGGLWLCSLGGHTNSSNPHLSTVPFGVDSGADVAVISPDTASDYTTERGQRKAMRYCTGKPVEDMGDTHLVLKGPLGNKFE